MRIIAGTLKGLKLLPVGDSEPARHLRPTSGRVRTSIFDILVHGQLGDHVTGARVLDLFAGTGAMGIEALSRGAVFAMFIDNGKFSNQLIRKNIDHAGVSSVSEVRRQDATRLGLNAGPPFDLVFLDPPYGAGVEHVALRSAASGGWLSDRAIVVAEEEHETRVPDLFQTVLFRKFGSTVVTFLRPAHA